ncbi:MAG: hypothetical protein IJT91_02845 [Clostridia bacterium]|nr:hypothetical protein [Clostridia bacterium]
MAIDIGNKRELFFDDYIVDKEKTTAAVELCRLQKKEKVFTYDAHWEQLDTVYQNIVKTPEGKYRMYYKSHYNGPKPDGAFALIRRICVIESDDGIHWTRPVLGITPIEDHPDTNIISGFYDYYDNMFVYYDENPDCPPEDKYKAIYGGWGEALFGYKSADGIHFRFYPDREKIERGEMAPPKYGVKLNYPPVGDRDRPSTVLVSTMESGCYFDSLNTMFYDKVNKKYVLFVRGFHIGDDLFPDDPDDPRAVRDIRRMESEDMIHFTHPELIEFIDDPGYDYQLYANAITPYYRAPHILIGTPTRYIARDWCTGFEELTNAEDRRDRGRGTSLNDAIFMASHDGGKTWKRYSEAILTSGPEQKYNWMYGDCYPCVGMIETPSVTPGTDPELSLYCKEHDKDGVTVLYRYTLRVDGFAARVGDFAGKTLVTKPFVYDGKELEINFASSAVGYMKIKLINTESGEEMYTTEIFGDSIARRVIFEEGKTPEAFAGKPVVMEVEMHDAKIYSFIFR